MTAERRTALSEVVKVDPEILHGTPCFTGTRVPVRTLFDFLEDGETIDAFLAVYPSIPRKQIVAFLEFTSELAQEQLGCASS